MNSISRWLVGPMVLLILLEIVAGEARAQYRFRHLTTRDGLIQGSVYYFLEDRQGLMWMTTQAGLNRFDGQHFRSFVHDQADPTSISKGEVRGLVEAQDGDIWLGTEVALSRYCRKTDRFQNYYLRDSLGQPIFAQHLPLHADDSTVWYLNNLEGLVRLNYHSGQRQVHYAEANYRYEFRTDIAHFDATRQVVWLVQPQGLVRYEARTGRTTHFFTGRKDDIFSEKLIVYGIFSNEKERMWLSTDKGLVELLDHHFRLHQVGIDMARDPVYSMATVPDGTLWLTTSNSGLIRYDPRQRRIVQTITHNPFQPNTLAGNFLSKVFVDSRGVLWINVDPKGVDIVFPDSLVLRKYDDNLLDPDDLNNASIRGISQDRQGNLWVGTTGEGVRKITAQGVIRRYGPERGFSQTDIRGIMADQKGNLWISTTDGLMTVPSGGDRATTIHLAGADPAKTNHLAGVVEASPGYLLMATKAGLLSHSLGRTKLLTDPGEVFFGAMYYHAPTRQLWAERSEKDLRCYELRSDTLLPLYDLLPGYTIMSIVPDPAPTKQLVLWLGTHNGLVQFDASERKVMRIFSRQDGLPDQVVYSTLFDDAGGLWISTNNGLVRMNRKGEFQHIRQSGGIEFNSFAAWKATDGRLYFGSTQALYYVRPEVLSRPSARGLRILSLRVNDSIYHYLPNSPANTPLPLHHTQNNLVFELAALDYLSEVPPDFEYRLASDSNSDGWVSNGSSPLIRFQNLLPGTYQVAFRAQDANGLYTETQSVVFLIQYPYWQRWWFIGMLLLLGGLILYGSLRMYLRRQQIAQQKLTSRIVAAQESERQRIAMDIHDDVNNTLAAAKGYLQSENKKEESLRAQHVERSRELIQKATEDLRAITHDLMPIQFDQYSLSEVVGQKVQEWNTANGTQFSFIGAGQHVKLSVEAELMIYRIISEMAQNIRKHAKAQTAIVQVIYQEDGLVISVEDNGVGFDRTRKAEEKVDGIGLKNIYLRAEYLKADLQISSDDRGVLIHIIVPYGPNRPYPRTFSG